jgi:hypothetical protein
MHIAEPLIRESISLEIENATEKLKDINLKILIKFRQNWS